MENKITSKNKLLLDAIDNYEDYTLLQRKMLKTFVNIAINDIVVITPNRIMELLGTTRATVYPAMKRFTNDKVILLDNDKGKIRKFQLNNNKLNEFIARFEKQKNITT